MFWRSRLDKLPKELVSNKKAYTCQYGWPFLTSIEMKKEKRSVVSFLDNATSYPKNALEIVKLIFLSQNMTSFGQPMEEDIIIKFKVIYRRVC